MLRLLRLATALAGLAVIVWIGADELRTNPLALTVTTLIGGFYLMGVFELHRFQQATLALAGLVDGLATPPPQLASWLDRLPAGLRHAVRRRVEGEPVGLPGPALAPSLAGLLVLLGMLGTFVGMVATLRGTGAALAGATDLAAVRESLVAPVRGLGLAFGTSVAGVAASAALGLLSALCRRERAQVGQRLDARIATTLRGFSVVHQREATLGLLQRQAAQMPALVDGLQALMGALERQAEASNARLLGSQERFQAQAAAGWAGLAVSVDRTLQTRLAENARLAGETLQAMAAGTLGGVARDAAALHASLVDTLQTQLERRMATAEAQTDALRVTLQQAHAEQAAASAARDEQRAAALSQAFDALAASLQREGQRREAEASARQQHAVQTMADTTCELAAQLEAQARRTSDEVVGLVQAAAEAPRAAAEVIDAWRRQLADGAARESTLLDERTRLLATLGSVLDGVSRAASAQRDAVDALVGAAAQMLERAVERFGAQVDADAGRLGAAAAQVQASAVEVASLGDAFGAAVQRFGDSNDRMGAHLQRIDAALGASMARSDEQLAYYVAQAREVIDLSLLSQRQILEDLQRLGAPAGVGP